MWCWITSVACMFPVKLWKPRQAEIIFPWRSLPWVSRKTQTEFKLLLPEQHAKWVLNKAWDCNLCYSSLFPLYVPFCRCHLARYVPWKSATCLRLVRNVILNLKDPVIPSSVAFLEQPVWHCPRWEKCETAEISGFCLSSLWMMGHVMVSSLEVSKGMLCCSLEWRHTVNPMQVQCW